MHIYTQACTHTHARTFTHTVTRTHTCKQHVRTCNAFTQIRLHDTQIYSVYARTYVHESTNYSVLIFMNDQLLHMIIVYIT